LEWPLVAANVAILTVVVVALVTTFQRSRDRLESERRRRALEALMVQEAERRRIARQLRDEVAQTLAGAMLQIEGLALAIPDALRPQLEELRETARHGTEEVRRIARGLRPVFRPLDELAATMRRHDPLSPGARASVPGDPALAALATAFNEMLDRLEFERRDSARQALRLQESERRRIARELHDEVGQTLTGAMLQIEALAPVIPDDLRPQLEELRETARHGTQEVRRIARRLRPEALDELGLQSALAALATAFAEHARVPIERRLQTGLELSKEEELVIYRVAQEALTNVVRHAQAEHATLDLRAGEDGIVLTVRDDGRGLAAEDVATNGIRGMRERAMLIGASLTIESAPGEGTEVRLAIPARHLPSGDRIA
jgi:two-component system sensor histidine kinase UhpB